LLRAKRLTKFLGLKFLKNKSNPFAHTKPNKIDKAIARVKGAGNAPQQTQLIQMALHFISFKRGQIY
jgi:hypothetical protein